MKILRYFKNLFRKKPEKFKYPLSNYFLNEKNSSNLEKFLNHNLLLAESPHIKLNKRDLERTPQGEHESGNGKTAEEQPMESWQEQYRRFIDYYKKVSREEYPEFLFIIDPYSFSILKDENNLRRDVATILEENTFLRSYKKKDENVRDVSVTRILTLL